MSGLPPGQRRVEGFPRFGAHFGQPPPAVPGDPVIELRGHRYVPAWALRPIYRLVVPPFRALARRGADRSRGPA